ncbi:hypothetical protein GWI33_009229 [Rhynchophorus ferrugineus]|uniref:Uncharacterized protein n=1 Tax=Rhynchophorus ferrugineus TaxID=354439 RepID=A0A834IPT1_RHYFE|nr:hypothetical protein GWI33_009229 [Rhynchophorus ferrugineus]
MNVHKSSPIDAEELVLRLLPAGSRRPVYLYEPTLPTLIPPRSEARHDAEPVVPPPRPPPPASVMIRDVENGIFKSL